MTHKQQQQRQLTRYKQQSTLGLVYQIIDQLGPVSRIEIADHAHLAPASITKLTRQLLPLGIIEEQEPQASTGGRRAINLATSPSTHQIVAVRIDRTQLHLGLCDLSGQTLASRLVDLHASNAAELLSQISDEVSTLLAIHIRKEHHLIAIAITCPGLLNTETGVISYSPHIPLEQPLAIADEISAVFNVPCYLGNSTRSLALAEHYFGNARDCRDVVVVRIDHGIGAGIIMDGEVLMGQGLNRGEIGHIQVNPLGERCHCGNFGCLETVAADDAVVKRVQQLNGSGYPTHLTVNESTTGELTMSKICQAALNGDQLAQQVLREAAEFIGKALATTVNLLNPQKIIIGGDLIQAWRIIEPVLNATLQQQTLATFYDRLQVRASSIEQDSLLAPFALIKRALNKGPLLHSMIEK
ncbi:ROK family transcriptional regulator [Neiella sp. HB171785]|uniref:ROK family transcriptional regulator n=1 Tax=Neiella litorisoli TaxID=2771431 RepID=A0A8J6UMB3_9GAMM|nr:ROK family protein [Neiella litorisoli]MBD1390435.1 ROK family transcriptional regulator [Neiella litorisoli]